MKKLKKGIKLTAFILILSLILIPVKPNQFVGKTRAEPAATALAIAIGEGASVGAAWYIGGYIGSVHILWTGITIRLVEVS